MDQKQRCQIIESLLLVHGEPITFDTIAGIIGCQCDDARNDIDILRKKYLEQASGFAILEHDNAVQLTTHVDCSSFLKKLARKEMSEKLSVSVLETLSIIVYRAPVSRGDVEAIRGVNSSFALRHLLMRGLIERTESENDNRTYWYKPSFSLLRTLGIQSLNKLPDYDSLSRDPRIQTTEENLARL